MTMIRTAIIDAASNLVTNIVRFDGAIPETPLPGQTWIASETANIGDTWDGTAFVPKPTPTPAPLSPNAAIDAQIAALEATMTPRRVREAATSDAGKAWLAALDSQISALRAQRK